MKLDAATQADTLRYVLAGGYLSVPVCLRMFASGLHISHSLRRLLQQSLVSGQLTLLTADCAWSVTVQLERLQVAARTFRLNADCGNEISGHLNSGQW